MHIAWYSEDKPFAVGYADGKLLIGSKEPLDKGAIVVIDAHKVESCCLSVYVVILSFKFQKERAVLLSARWIRCTFIADADSKSFVRSRSAAWSGVQRVRCCWRVLKRRLWNCGPIQTPALTPALAGTAYRALDTPPWLMVWPGAACLGAVQSPSACSPCTLTLNVPSVLGFVLFLLSLHTTWLFWGTNVFMGHYAFQMLPEWSGLCLDCSSRHFKLHRLLFLWVRRMVGEWSQTQVNGICVF